MPDPSTTRLTLYKSKSDGSELVNYTQDLGQNWDKVDTAVGYQVVTSSTRPATPYPGKPITESDTGYRTLFSNGTSPASASWVEIPNSSATFNNNLKLASGKQVNINASGSTASFAAVNAATTTDALSLRVTGDTQDRFLADTDGTLNWGPGNATPDTNLFRSAANTLRTNDNLTVDLNLAVTGNLAVAGIGQIQYIAKSADETVTSNTTLQNDDHLVLPAVANAVYTFEVDLYMTDTADFVGDFKMSFTCPTGATFDMHGAGAHTTDLASGTSANGEWIGKLATASAGANLTFGVGFPAVTGVRVYGRLVMSSTAGNFQLQWAQNAADASGTTLKAGSYMTMTRVG